MAVETSGDAVRISAPSLSQQSLWVLCQLTPDEPIYNESNVFRLKGVLDVGALTKALNEIVRRHESLRTRFRIVDGRATCVDLRPFDPARLPPARR